MSKVLTIPALALAVALCAGSAQAQSRLFVGARNLAMGGTGVGSAGDALAVHYNPAGMAFSKGWEIEVPLVTLDTEMDGNTLDSIDELLTQFGDDNLRKIQERLDSGEATEEDLEKILEVFLDILPDLDTLEDGALVRATIGPAYRQKTWGVSAFYSASGGLDALVDLNTGLSLSALGLAGAIPDPAAFDSCAGDPTCLGYSEALVQETGIDQARAEVLVAAAGDNLVGEPRAFEILTEIVEETQPGNPTLVDNPSEVNGTGILVGQAAFTYSHLIYREKLAIGANAKIMSGRTFSTGTRIAEIDGDDSFRDFLEPSNTETELELGLDLGLMYRPTPRWSFGLVVDNLNKPSFDLSGNRGSIDLEPLVRFGAAVRPLRWFNAAVDVDLNEVDSGIVNGLGYRYANFGAEFLVGTWFAGRVGAYRNLGATDSSVIYTGGVSFGLPRFSVDLALGAAAERTGFESGLGNSVPKGFAASIQLNWRSKAREQQIQAK